MDANIGKLAACVAVSLYHYNVDAYSRATKLYDHFIGECAGMDDLLHQVESPFWSTEMAAPTAMAYLQQALNAYGDEAMERTIINLGEI